ncbi:MAG TPA: glycosyltransferase family 87 protein, partial [Leptolinea sp.]
MAVLIGASLISICVFLILTQLLGKNRVQELPKDTYTTFLVLIIIFSGLIVLVFPLPQRLTPDQIQTIMIQPDHSLSSTEIKSVLIEEIRINGTPINLIDYMPSSGWKLTPFGVESVTGNKIPFVMQNKTELTSNVKLLLGKGPHYGRATISLGWNQQQINLYQPDQDAEIILSIPPLSNPMLWNLIYFISIWFLVIGFLYLCANAFSSNNITIKIIEKINHTTSSVLFWIVIAFLFWYSLAFIRNVFFDPSHMMQNGNFLPAIRPIGNDLSLILDASKSILTGGSPYTGANKYPPAATVFFTPLASLSFLDAFQIITVINYLFFAFITLGLPFFITNQRKLPSFAWFLFATGLYSYGLLFEIERGQFNLIAMGLAFLAILLFHKTPRLHCLAYILFCISIQLKIYPAIFVVFLADDWKDWKRTLTRWIALGLANVSLLFILGAGIMYHYVTAISNVVSSVGKSDWPVSHSINWFVTFVGFYINFSSETFRIIQFLL